LPPLTSNNPTSLLPEIEGRSFSVQKTSLALPGVIYISNFLIIDFGSSEKL